LQGPHPSPNHRVMDRSPEEHIPTTGAIPLRSSLLSVRPKAAKETIVQGSNRQGGFSPSRTGNHVPMREVPTDTEPGYRVVSSQALRSLLGVTPPIHPQHQSAVLRLPVWVRDKISSGSRAHRKLYGAPSSIRVSRMPCYGAHGPVPEKATGHQPCVVALWDKGLVGWCDFKPKTDD
jgi:hypothetical protein